MSKKQSLPIDYKSSQYDAIILFADGSYFLGYGFGAKGYKVGEVCFNTAMTGHQEILTDPSYAGQIVTFTFPHIGNVGTNEHDIESHAVFAHGLITREFITKSSNYRSQNDFIDWLEQNNVIGISGIDTRALTHKIRKGGPQNAVIYYHDSQLTDKESIPFDMLNNILREAPSLNDLELADKVTTDKSYEWLEGEWNINGYYNKQNNPEFRIVLIDYGVKYSIIRCLSERGCRVTIVPATASYEEIIALKPHGVCLSNGPGDPVATFKYTGATIKKLIDDNIPMLCICLGHQLLALAMGGKTEKMLQGHRGANHPVKNLETNIVEITSQNHGFAVIKDNLPDNVQITHHSLFDGTIEGIKLKDKDIFSVQYHPESSPGPDDSRYLFDNFIEILRKRQG